MQHTNLPGTGMTLCRIIALTLTILGALAGCSNAAQDKVTGKPALALQACRLDGVSVEARCGRLTVFEDRVARSGAQIDIHFAVVPAVAADPLPDPIVFFAGGPGQSAIKLAGAAYYILERARRDREVVLIDIRGTGKSHALDCGQPIKRTELAVQLAALDPAVAAKDCLSKFGAGIRHYTTPNAAADVRDVLDALGYAKVNLWGVSYGTRLGLEFLRQNPARVRSMVLDGVAPTDIKLPLYFSRDGEQSLRRLIADCEADKACSQAMQGLRKDVEQVVDGLRQAPAKITVIDPSSGQKSKVTIDANVFHSGLRAALYSGELSSLVPLIVHEAKAGNFGPFLAQSTWSFGELEQSMALGLMLNVMCNEEVPRVTGEELGRETTSPVFRADLFEAVQKACAVWPQTQIPAAYYDAVKSDVPTLLFSGGLDPATPPVWGELVAKRLANGRHLVAPNLGHNVSPRGCAPKLIAEFIRKADARELDGECLKTISRPRFFINYAGPQS
jgi:pimeloyl-ACP methyl ester carboxylesterase